MNLGSCVAGSQGPLLVVPGGVCPLGLPWEQGGVATIQPALPWLPRGLSGPDSGEAAAGPRVLSTSVISAQALMGVGSEALMLSPGRDLSLCMWEAALDGQSPQGSSLGTGGACQDGRRGLQEQATPHRLFSVGMV